MALSMELPQVTRLWTGRLPALSWMSLANSSTVNLRELVSLDRTRIFFISRVSEKARWVVLYALVLRRRPLHLGGKK
jgi:hypothetical protein